MKRLDRLLKSIHLIYHSHEGLARACAACLNTVGALLPEHWWYRHQERLKIVS